MATTPTLVSSWLLLVRRDCGFAEPSTSSDDSERGGMELPGDRFFGLDRALLAARPEEIEELEEFDCCCDEGLGCEVRAREERRGDIAGFGLPRSRKSYSSGAIVSLILLGCQQSESMALGPCHPLEQAWANVPSGQEVKSRECSVWRLRELGAADWCENNGV